MSSTTVHVKNISPETSEKEVRDFFSFCGKISNISVTESGGSNSAAVTFEKPTAAKTALLLDNTQLGPNLVSVTTSSSSDESTSSSSTTAATEKGTTSSSSEDVDQEDKPRSRILAEYLAHGYAISDKAITHAITLDQQHGVSTRFTNALQQFDAKYHATDNAKSLDARLGVTEKANNAWAGLSSYFEKAMGTPSGQKVRDFYVGGSQQVMDVHTEAKRLAAMKAGKSGGNMGVEQVPGTDKTKCGCGGDTGSCPCEAGKCACATCPKNDAVGGSGSDEKTAYA